MVWSLLIALFAVSVAAAPDSCGCESYCTDLVSNFQFVKAVVSGGSAFLVSTGNRVSNATVLCDGKVQQVVVNAGAVIQMSCAALSCLQSSGDPSHVDVRLKRISPA
jgi:hypothetical protein